MSTEESALWRHGPKGLRLNFIAILVGHNWGIEGMLVGFEDGNVRKCHILKPYNDRVRYESECWTNP